MSDSQLDRIEIDVRDIKKALFTGNGAPPVLARLATLEERTKWLGRGIAALIGAALGVGVAPK